MLENGDGYGVVGEGVILPGVVYRPFPIAILPQKQKPQYILLSSYTAPVQPKAQYIAVAYTWAL